MSVLNALSLSRIPAIAFVALGLYWGAFAALVPVLKAGINADDAAFGLLLLGSALGLITAMWLAPHADRVLGARAMPVAALVLAVAFLLPGLARGPVAFCATMAVVGAASGLLDVVMNTRVSELEAGHKRSLMNANHAMFSLAYGVAAILTGLAREAGWTPVAVFAALGLVTLVLARRMRMAAALPVAHDGVPGRLPWGVIGLCGGIVLIGFMAEASVESWSALHVERTLGGGAAEGALGPAALGLTMALGRFSGQVVAERFREVVVIFWAAVMASSGAVIAALAASPLMAYVGFAVVGLGVSVIGPMGLAVAGRLAPPDLRGLTISRVAVVAFSGFLVAPVLMGVASEMVGLRGAFMLVSAVCLGVLPLTLLLGRR